MINGQSPGEPAFTDKQRQFCREYLVDLNATQAAIRAGYSKKTARGTAWQLLQKPEIQAEIQRLMDKRANRTEITADRVLMEIARVAFLDPRRFYDGQGRLLPIGELPDDVAAALASMEEVVSKVPGEPDEVEYTKKIKMADKLRALELAGKHLKLFTDKVELSGELSLAERLAKRRQERRGG